MVERRDVPDLLRAVPEARRRDAEALIALMTEVTGEPPAVWPGSIVGFGTRHYRYASGREGDTVRVGFAPRTGNLVLYLTGLLDDYADLLQRLGPYRHGKGCVYLRRLSDADEAVLRAVVDRSYQRGADPHEG